MFFCEICLIEFNDNMSLLAHTGKKSHLEKVNVTKVRATVAQVKAKLLEKSIEFGYVAGPAQSEEDTRQNEVIPGKIGENRAPIAEAGEPEQQREDDPADQEMQRMMGFSSFKKQ